MARARDNQGLRARPRERVAGGVFQGMTRVAGLRPGMLPDHLRRQLRLIGATDEQLRRILPRMRTLADWPYAWEDEGDRRAAAGDHQGAFTSYYVAQRILLVSSALKSRLYEMAVAHYLQIDQPTIERIETTNERGERIRAYLQLPDARPRPVVSRGSGGVPCVLLVPGITGTKEELDPWSRPLLRRGYAVVRMDNPVYGETEGILDTVSGRNPVPMFEHLLEDPRIDPTQVHIHGMSMGAHFALHAALDPRAASATVICPPFAPSAYFEQLPTSNLTALRHMTGCDTIDELRVIAADLSMEHSAERLTLPLRIFHGGRDRTIPAGDSVLLARHSTGPSALTVYERDHHNCLEHVDEIAAHTLEFLDDPVRACARSAAIEHVDEAATIHVTDADARDASAGTEPRRKPVRLPFLLPGVRPRSSRL